MQIKTMLVPCGPSSDPNLAHSSAALVEVEVAVSFTRVLEGREFRFCIHPDTARRNFWTLSHYETGFRVTGLVDDDDIESDGKAILEDVIRRNGETKVRKAIEEAAKTWRVNGCFVCSGTGFATVGGTCFVCNGSGIASKPKERPTAEEDNNVR